MKIVLISDTHEQHEQVTIPSCDILIHAGDLTYRGKYSQVQEAFHWLDKQPAKYVVCIAGNHDFLFENYAMAADDIRRETRILYLENTEVNIEGVKFWGSPYTPKFFDWAFMYDRADGKTQWDLIPENVDVLITHGPPLGIGDQSAPQLNSEHLGCFDLREAVNKIKPRIHVFGHIHGGYGSIATVGTDWQKKPIFYNASVVNEAYKVVNKPFVIEL